MKPFSFLSKSFNEKKLFSLILVGVGCLIFMLLEIKNNRFWLADFEVYYKAAGRILHGENLYRIAADDFYIFKYSPASAIFFIPFTVVPFFAAKIIYWIMLTAAIVFGFVLSIKLIAKRFDLLPAKKINLVVLLGALILAVHFQRELHLGQVNHLLLVFYLLSALLFIRKKPVASSAILAMSVFIKPFAFIFIPYFLVKKNFRAVFWFVVFSLVIFLLPLIFYGPSKFLDQNLGWLTEMKIELNNKQDVLQLANHTIFSVIARYSPLRLINFTDDITKIYQFVLLICIALMVLWFIRRGKINPAGGTPEFALLISLIPLLSFTSQNAFGFTELLVFLLLFHFNKLSFVEKIMSITGFLCIGGNIHDLWGNKLSGSINDLSLISIGTIVLLIVLFRKRMQAVL